jgi:hypothetical protein
MRYRTVMPLARWSHWLRCTWPTAAWCLASTSVGTRPSTPTIGQAEPQVSAVLSSPSSHSPLRCLVPLVNSRWSHPIPVHSGRPVQRMFRVFGCATLSLFLCTVHCALCTVVQLVGIEYHRALWYPRMVSANGISLPVSIRNKFADFTPAFDAARRAQLKIAVSHSAYR